MSDIVYNGADVDAGIEIMRGYLDTYDTIQSNIESTASALSGTTGFGLLGSGAKVKTLASSVEDSKNKYTELISSVRAIQMTLMKYDEGKEYMSSFLKSLSDEEWNALTGSGKLNREEFEKYLSGKDYDITTALTLLQVKSPEDDASWWGKLVRGTKTAGLGFVEGFFDFGETAVDSVVLGWGCLRALFANNKADAAAIMEETRAKVEFQWSKSVVDNWIDTADCLADVRQFRDTHPEAYNTTRGVAKGLGYATATLLTAKGIGAGVKFLKGSQNLTAGLIAANSGVLGFSSGTEEAWASGADTSAGLKAGLANGAWEAVQWGAGAKINMATEGMGKLGSAIRVGTDALTGTVEGGVIDPTKNLLLHSGEEGYTWDQAFEDAGGVKNVVSKTAIAGGTSLINEGIDAAKGAVKNHFANKSNAPDAVTAAAKNAVDTPSKTDFADTGTSAVDAPSRSNIADAGTSAVDAPSRSSLADAGTSAVDTPSRSSIADAGTSAVDAPSRSSLADAGTSAVDAPSRSKLADAGTSVVDAPSRSKLADAGTSAVDAPNRSSLADAGTSAVDVPSRSKLADAGTSAVDAPSKSSLADAGSRGNTTLKTQKDALGGETKIWETESNGNVTQRIVEGPTGKTTQTDYIYSKDANGNTVKTTVSQTHGGKNNIEAHVSSRETIDASGNVTSKEVFDANGNSKYTQQMTRNGNEVKTDTKFTDGRQQTRTVSTATDINGNKTKEIDISSSDGTKQLTSISDDGKIASIKENPDGSIVSTYAKNGEGKAVIRETPDGSIESVSLTESSNRSGGSNGPNGGSGGSGGPSGGSGGSGGPSGGSGGSGGPSGGSGGSGGPSGGSGGSGGPSGGSGGSGGPSGGSGGPGGNTTTKLTTQKDALGGETKIWETTDVNGKVTQRIVEGPTGKTTQTDYTYRTDTNGNTVKETVSQTHGGKNDIAAHVSSRETIDASGNVTSKEVFDANGNSKYTQQMTRNGNEVTTKTTFADGRTSSKTVTTSVDNGKTIKDIEVADASGGTTRTRVTDTVDAAGNKTQVESLKTGYNDQNNKSITSTVEYDATGHVKNKDIGMTEAVVNKRGKTVFEQSRKTVEYENNNGTTRKVTTDFGPKKKDVEINIKQRADANSDTKIVAEKKYKDLNIAEKEYVREQSKKYMKAESGKGFNKYSEAGRGELADRYTRELALKEGKMTPEIRTRAEEMADSVLGSKIPGFNSTNRAGKEALRQEGISDGMEKLIDNPLSKTDTLIYGGKAIARKAATGLGIGLGGLGAIGAVGNAINAGGSTPPYQTLPPTTDPTTPTPPTSGPYPGPSPSPYPSGGDDGNNGGGDDGGNDNTPDTTPITTPDTTPDTTPPTIPGDNGNNNSGGNNQGWNNSNGGYEPNPDESLDKDDPNNGDLSDEDKLPDDDNLGDIEDDSIYTIPTITNTDKKVTKDGINAIPILAGLGLAAAAGVGAKIYMDNKKNNDNGEEEYDDEFQSDSDYMSDSDFDTLSSQDSDLIADDWKEESAPQEGDEGLDYEKPSFYSDTLGEEI